MEETRIKFKELYITNFRNISDLHITFNEGITELQAENGVGKTNTLSAILWCLFGKNIYDEKNFTISPIIDGEEKNDITTNVKLILNDNYVISRSYYKRKTTLRTGYIFDGQESLTDITQTNFEKEFSDKFVSLGTVKSLSNINYLPNLHWKELKQLILDLIGDIKDEEILLQDDFSLIEEQIRLTGINNTRNSLNESEKSLKQDITKKETEYQTLVNTKEKYVADNEDTEKYKQEKDDIELQLKTANKIVEYNKKIDEEDLSHMKKIQEEELELERNHSDIHQTELGIESLENQYKLNATDIDVVRKQEINYVQEKINTCKNRIEQLTCNNQTYNENLQKLKQSGEELKAKEVKVEKDTCSACGQHLPEEMIQATLENLKQQQLDKLNAIKSECDNTKVVIESNTKELEEKEKELEVLKQELKNIQEKVYDVSLENEKQKEIRVKKEQLEIQFKELVSVGERLQEELENMKSSYTIAEKKETIDTTQLFARYKELESLLASSTTLEKINDDIDVVNKELESLKNNLVVIKQKQELVSKFNNLKSEVLRQKVKSNFNIVDFKVKEYTLDGVEQETFKICIDGVDYNELNNGMKILVALDLINGIQKLKKIFVPIIIDNLESLTSEINYTDTQLIIARAVKEINKIEVTNGK